MKIGKYNYNRVSKQMPCPVCQRTKYCLVSDCGEYILCTKVETGTEYKSYHAWLHHGKTFIPRVRVIKSKDYEPDIKYIERVFTQLDFSLSGLFEFEKLYLGVSVKSLQDMRVGMLGNAWCFPMSNGKHQLIGLKQRWRSGYKCCIGHSQMGVYIPSNFQPNKPVYIHDGETDTAAMHGLGYNVLGRASESSCKQILKELLVNCPEVNIVPDNDPHGSGYKYARVLAVYLRRPKCKVNIFLHRDHKDIRKWINSGTFTDEKLQDLKQEIK